MSNVARRTIGRAPVSANDYLGPAAVVRVAGADVVVEMPDGSETAAEMAFAFPYAPAEGDVLLVIGRDAATYAIGVLRGAGKTSLRFAGDVDLVAEGGTLRLAGDAGVEVTTQELRVRADRVRTFAGSVIEKVGSLVQRVTGLLSSHAREAQTIVEESSLTQAKSATVVTEDTMTIQARQIHLG
jgi:hypothetical protein